MLWVLNLHKNLSTFAVSSNNLFFGIPLRAGNLIFSFPSNTSAISSVAVISYSPIMRISSSACNAVKISMVFFLSYQLYHQRFVLLPCNYHPQPSFFLVLLFLTQQSNYCCEQYLLGELVFVMTLKIYHYSIINLAGAFYNF